MKDVKVRTRPQTPSAGMPKSEMMTAGPTLTRRHLLAGTGQVALLTVIPLGCVQLANNPFSDGTFWDDGFGWAE